MLRRHLTAITVTCSLLLALPAAYSKALGDNAPTIGVLRQLQPPGGIPLSLGRPGQAISSEALKKVSERLDSAPDEALTKWVTELERIMGKPFDSDLEAQGCRTYFVMRVSVAFDDLRWNARSADLLFRRAESLTPAESKAWTEAFGAVLKKEIERPFMVPLALIPVAAIHEGQNYNAVYARKYRSRLLQLTPEDVSLWRKQVDQFEGTEFDAATNIMLLDDFYPGEVFQRDRFRAVIGAAKS